MVSKLFIVALVLLPFYCIILHLLRGKKSTFWYAFKAFVLGAISTFPIILSHEFHVLDVPRLHIGIGIIATTCLMAGFEEISKKVAEHFHGHVHKEEEDLPVVKWMSVGLGFAYLENVLYISEALGHGDIVAVTSLRLVFGTLAHTTFTSLSGYLSLGAAGPFISHARGFFGASISHSAYNLLNYYHYTLLTVPLLIFTIIYLFVLHKKHRRVRASRGDPPH